MTPTGPTTMNPTAATLTGARTDDLAAAEARAGAMAMLPFVVGYAPFALVIGSAIGAHPDPVAAWSGSWLVYGGSAQLAALRALDHGGLVLAVLTGLLINSRLLVYSASLAPRWRTQPSWFRLVAAALVIDPTWAALEHRAEAPSSDRAARAWFLAAGITLGIGWSAIIAAGAVAGDRLAGFGLEVFVPLCLLALVAPRLKEPDTRVVVLVAAVVMLVGRGLPSGTGLLAAVALGGLAGALTDRHRS